MRIDNPQFRYLIAAATVTLLGAAAADGPRVFLLPSRGLRDARQRMQARDPRVITAWDALKKAADAAVDAGPFSVTSKSVTPPSGDRHDYLSQAPYWWPNPATANGLPYIRRDGERNPELDRISDHQQMDRMISAVETLALAAYFGGDERHANKAAGLLRAWFIDPATRMNPHLTYAQFIPGINTGRGIGLIETRGLVRVVDAIGLLEDTAALTAGDRRALREWFTRFLAWMRDSAHGRDEAAAKNNHGTYYDLQVACYALFTGEDALARRILTDARLKRVAAQIEPDGRQPLELDRTRSWGYSVMNIDGLTQLAVLGEQVGVDLWDFHTADGRSIRTALVFLAPYALGDRKWTGAQITEFQPQALASVLRRAAERYRDQEFQRIVARMPPLTPADRAQLFAR